MSTIMQVPDALLLLVASIALVVAGWVWAGLLWVSVRIYRGEHYSIEPGMASALFIFLVAVMFGGWWLSAAVRLFGLAQEVAR
jgi:hypothetical protein